MVKVTCLPFWIVLCWTQHWCTIETWNQWLCQGFPWTYFVESFEAFIDVCVCTVFPYLQLADWRVVNKASHVKNPTEVPCLWVLAIIHPYIVTIHSLYLTPKIINSFIDFILINDITKDDDPKIFIKLFDLIWIKIINIKRLNKSLRI